MFKNEEIESWNEIFAKGRIQEADLKHPTEGFLVRTLVAYLEIFGYKVEAPASSDLVSNNTREKRLFLVRLAQNIDRILKFTDKSYCFFYYDLVQPVSKKTSHVLGILLNYYYYYNMFKKEVFAMANDRIKSHEELLEKIQATQQDNGKRQQRAEKIKEEIAKLSETVPTLKSQLDAWQSQKTQQEEQLRKEHDAVESLNEKLVNLRAQERNLKKQIVEDMESLKLQSELTSLQENIEDLLSAKRNLESILNERMEIIKSSESLLKHLEEAKNLLPTSSLDDYKDHIKKLKQSKVQHDSLARKKVSLLDIIAKQEMELQCMEEKLKTKKQEFEKEKTAKQEIISEKEGSIVPKQQTLKHLKNQLLHDENLLEEQRAMRNFLKESISEIMQHYIS